MAASGNVRYSQIRSGDRTGSGSRIVTAASGTLTQNVPLLYDSSGNVVATATRSGNTTEFATITGTKTQGKQLQFDSSGNIVASSAGVGGGGGMLTNVVAPVSGDFSWVNQGSATVTQSQTSVVLYAPANASNSLRCRVKTAPATPYTIEVGYHYFGGFVNYAEAGVIFRESSTGKIVTCTWGSGATYLEISSSKWTNATTYNSTYSITASPSNAYDCWIRITDNGTNRIIYWSPNGFDWFELHSVSRTDFLTGGADQVGFYCNSANSKAVYMNLFHWNQF